MCARLSHRCKGLCWCLEIWLIVVLFARAAHSTTKHSSAWRRAKGACVQTPLSVKIIPTVLYTRDNKYTKNKI